MSVEDLASVVVKESYFSPEYVDLEYARLWPRVWQMACREEELENVGDYITYDIGVDTPLRPRDDGVREVSQPCPTPRRPPHGQTSSLAES